MKIALRATQQFALATIPTLVAGAFAASPSLAATFSLAETEVIFSNFNIPEATDLTTATDTNTVALASQGEVTASANAEAAFVGSPASAKNLATSEVSGTGFDYTGIAQGEASVSGRFLVQSLFSFNFQALLNLATSVDDTAVESAKASGNVLFQLFDSTNPHKLTLLDTFSLKGLLDSASSDDFLKSHTSSNITLLPGSSVTKSFGGNEESAIASVSGLYQRTFKKPLFITLVESKSVTAIASAPVNAGAVPEPFTVFGTIVGVAGGVILKRRTAIANCKQ
jgi:hypothetical protein